MAPHAALVFYRGFPDSEESKDMVYAVCVKIVCKMGETVPPPGVVVFCHLIPVIGWESPVLAVGREEIRRSTGLLGKVEEMRVLPCLNAVSGYSNWNVTFQCHTFFVGILLCLDHLFVQVILYKKVEMDICI